MSPDLTPADVPAAALAVRPGGPDASRLTSSRGRSVSGPASGTGRGPGLTGLDLGAVRSIVIVRANGLGDYLLAEPAIAALRAAAPDAHLVLVGQPWHAAALAGRPGPLDEIVVAPYAPGVRNPPRPGLVNPQGVSDFSERMRARRFDLAVQLHGGGRNSNPFTRSLGARWNIGLRAPDAPPMDADISYQYWQHETARYLEVVGLAGAPAVRWHPRFVVVPEDLAAARTALDRIGLPTVAVKSGRPLAVVHPGASDPRRQWPPERFAQACRALAEAGADVVVVGSADDADLVAGVLEHAPRALGLVDQLDVGGLAGLLALASVMLGNDSGPRHLAGAVGTASVSVYWCGNVINAGPLDRGRHRVHISWTVACPTCGASCVGEPFPPRCSHDPSFVTDVPASAVTASALELLAAVRQEPAPGPGVGVQPGTSA